MCNADTLIEHSSMDHTIVVALAFPVVADLIAEGATVTTVVAEPTSRLNFFHSFSLNM